LPSHSLLSEAGFPPDGVVTGWQPGDRLLITSQQLNLPSRCNQTPGWYNRANIALLFRLAAITETM